VTGGQLLDTYQQGDGVPEGEYVLTFAWGQPNRFNNIYGGPDRLANRYSDPRQPKVRFKVEKGKPADLGRIELSTN